MLEDFYRIKRGEKLLTGKNKKSSIYFLQELHSTNDKCNFWENEWSTKLFSVITRLVIVLELRIWKLLDSFRTMMVALLLQIFKQQFSA